MHPVGKTIRGIEKWMIPFLMDTTSSITMQSLENIVQRAVCRCENVVFVCFYRQDCRVAANCRYCFYSQAKNQVFRPAGATRCTDSGHTLQYRRGPGSAWLCKISRQSMQTGGNATPKYQKFPLFGKESPRRGDSLHRFPKFFWTFIRLTILR